MKTAWPHPPRLAAETPSWKIHPRVIPESEWRLSGGGWQHHEQGLRVDVEVEAVGTAMAQTVFLTNLAGEHSALLEGNRFIHHTWELTGQEVIPSVFHCTGGLTDAAYPGQAWRLQRTELPDWSSLKLGSIRGRSSAKDLPLFLLSDLEEAAGLAVALGFSCSWTATILRNQDGRTVALEAGPVAPLRLPPGERVRLGSCLMVPYSGDFVDGSNALRRHLQEFVCPPLDGPPRSVFVSWFGIQHEGNETVFEGELEAYAGIGAEVFEIDAAWSAQGTHRHYGAGNWLREDASKFPGGLNAFAEKVRKKGLTFGLWIEPETVEAGTQLALEIEPWLLGASDAKRFLVDLSHPDAAKRLGDVLVEVLLKYNVGWTRFDSNLDPQPYWETFPDVGERGFRELKHFEALYGIMDRLRRELPHLHIETCSSGGLRIDLEMLRRSHSIWISDNTVFPATMRQHISGANRFLPSHLLHVELVGDYHLCKSGVFHPFDPASWPAEHYLVAFGGLLGFGQPLNSGSTPIHRHFQSIRQGWVGIRGNLDGEFYPLTPQPRTLKEWEAWLFVSKDQNSAHVAAFRRLAEENHRVFVLRGLDPRQNYQIRCELSCETIGIFTGQELMTEGLVFNLPHVHDAELFVLKSVGMPVSCLRENQPRA